MTPSGRAGSAEGNNTYRPS